MYLFNISLFFVFFCFELGFFCTNESNQSNIEFDKLKQFSQTCKVSCVIFLYNLLSEY